MTKNQQSHTSEVRLAHTSFCLVQSKSESISKKQKTKMGLMQKRVNTTHLRTEVEKMCKES